MPKAYGYCRLSKDEITATCSACQAEWSLKITNIDQTEFDCPYCGHTYRWDTRDPISIQSQSDKCYYLAENHVPRVVDPDVQIFVDLNVSRDVPIWDRPQGKNLFDSLRQGDYLIIPILDRAFGDIEDCANKLKYFLKQKIHVVIGEFPDVDIQTPMGRMMVQMAAMFAELELSKISERTKTGIQKRRDLGKPFNRCPPRGYQLICTQCGHRYSHAECNKGKFCPGCKHPRNGNTTHIPDPNEQMLMWRILWHRSAYAWLDWDMVAHSLNEEGFRTREGKKIGVKWCRNYYDSAVELLSEERLGFEHRPPKMQHLSIEKIPNIPKRIAEKMEARRRDQDARAVRQNS